MAYEHLSAPHRILVLQAISQRLDGASVFAPTLPQVRRDLGFERPPPDDWGPVIEAIESAGWRLEQWAVVASQSGTEAFPVFRASPDAVDRPGGGE